VPIGNGAMENRTFIEWDKDDIEELGILKIDVLALGMLTCIRKCFDLIALHHGERWELATIPREVAEVYDMLCRGDSLGVFQVESRAQMNMLPRLKPREFYDLVIEVAIVRPGPIQGDMVHPYLKRRSGKEPVTFPCPDPAHGEPDELEKILGRTLGVPIFQEQAMKIALDAAKFTSEEANKLRKAMATFRSKGNISELEDMMVGRMVARGYDYDFAQRCFDQIKGFGEYGFPESHAASFAHLVYVSSWLKWKYPAAFACALLNSQPMGFYAPAQIVRDAREHGVEVHEVDVNCSDWDCTLESGALRLGLRQIDGLQREAADKLVSRRPYRAVEELRSRGGVPVHAVQRLAAADAFRSMGLDRRAALWDSRALRQAPDLPLFNYAEARDEGAEIEPATLPTMPLSEHVVNDYQTIRLSLKAHPMGFLREHYARLKFVTADQLKAIRDGKRLSIAGLVLIRQRPGSAKGVVFITIEDETGIANLVVWPDVFEKQRKIVMGARLMAVHGIVQRDPDSDVIHVVARRLEDHSHMLKHLSHDAMPSTLSQGDAAGSWRAPAARHPRDVEIIPKSRDFH
jgi:error-prone DNA polymerase